MLIDTQDQLAGVQDIINFLEEDKEKIREVYVVTITHDGRVATSVAGNWQNLSKAAAFLMHEFHMKAANHD